MLCTLLLLLLVLNPFLHVIFAETVYACLWSCIFFLHLAEVEIFSYSRYKRKKFSQSLCCLPGMMTL
uniref:Uncharacterized protein n=1 Tax=Gossypium raimondii TaxID=29730 RepID=A0A0D2R3F7_GOSRA|nr:hypothetical protein B456_010G070500 [Gossypium raimondii]